MKGGWGGRREGVGGRDQGRREWGERSGGGRGGRRRGEEGGGMVRGWEGKWGRREMWKYRRGRVNEKGGEGEG